MNVEQLSKLMTIIGEIVSIADSDPKATYFQDDDKELRITLTIRIKK